MKMCEFNYAGAEEGAAYAYLLGGALIVGHSWGWKTTGAGLAEKSNKVEKRTTELRPTGNDVITVCAQPDLRHNQSYPLQTHYKITYLKC